MKGIFHDPARSHFVLKYKLFQEKKLCNLLVDSMDNKFKLVARLESGKTCKAKYKILSIYVRHI